jgi:hypothetical protein
MKIPARNKIRVNLDGLNTFLFTKSRQRVKDAQVHLAELVNEYLSRKTIDTVVFAGENARGVAKRLPYDFSVKYRVIPITKSKDIDVNERVAILADKPLIKKAYATVITEFPLKAYIVEFFDASDNQLFL